MIIDDPVDHFYTNLVLIFWSKKLDPDSLSIWIKIFVQEQFFHFFVNDEEALLKYGLKEYFFSSGPEIYFRIIDHLLN